MDGAKNQQILRLRKARSVPFVLSARCRAAAQMTLRLVGLQHLPDLRIQDPVYRAKSVRHVLMYSAFANAVFFGGGADGRFVFYDVLRQLNGSPFDIGFQMHHSK